MRRSLVDIDVFMIFLLIKHRDDFTLPFSFLYFYGSKLLFLLPNIINEHLSDVPLCLFQNTLYSEISVGLHIC
jgi:hypothetical protein